MDLLVFLLIIISTLALYYETPALASDQNPHPNIDEDRDVVSRPCAFFIDNYGVEAFVWGYEENEIYVEADKDAWYWECLWCEVIDFNKILIGGKYGKSIYARGTAKFNDAWGNEVTLTAIAFVSVAED